MERMLYKLSIALVLITLAVHSPIAHALPNAAKMLSSNNLFQTFANGGVITCGRPGLKFLSGLMVGENKDYFLSRKAKIKIFKKKIKKFTLKGLFSKVSKFQKKLKKQKQLKKIEDPICLDQGGSSSGGNFDDFGNVTEAGKIAFEIPSYLSANIDTGSSIYKANCTGCHGEKIGYSYVGINNAFATISAMSFFQSQLSDSDVAQIAAYLNRFNG